jgi:hypothetical protein
MCSVTVQVHIKHHLYSRLNSHILDDTICIDVVTVKMNFHVAV